MLPSFRRRSHTIGKEHRSTSSAKREFAQLKQGNYDFMGDNSLPVMQGGGSGRYTTIAQQIQSVRHEVKESKQSYASYSSTHSNINSIGNRNSERLPPQNLTPRARLEPLDTFSSEGNDSPSTSSKGNHHQVTLPTRLPSKPTHQHYIDNNAIEEGTQRNGARPANRGSDLSPMSAASGTSNRQHVSLLF